MKLIVSTRLTSHALMSSLNGLLALPMPAKSSCMSSTRDVSQPETCPCMDSDNVWSVFHFVTAADSVL